MAEAGAKKDMFLDGAWKELADMYGLTPAEAQTRWKARVTEISQNGSDVPYAENPMRICIK